MLGRLLSHWYSEPEIANNIAGVINIPAREPDFKNFPEGIHPLLLQTLEARGIESLYSHQKTAWDLFQIGKNIVIVSGTASGKSLAYNLPVLDNLLKNHDTRALYIHPTKALSQDQFFYLQSLYQSEQLDSENLKNGRIFDSKSINAAIYDGDTSKNVRNIIRKNSRIVLTNPDMLHLGILPHHTSWSEFFSNLHVVVIDEIHIYRGVFGSHFANVVRRLKRISNFYGTFPRFILTSATIANPSQFSEKLIEEKFEIIQNDGSARGKQSFLIYNPPIINEELGLRRSSLKETTRLVDDLLAYDIQTIIFGRSRRTVEIILNYLRKMWTAPPKYHNTINYDEQIHGYRSGYLSSERRKIELGLRNGTIRAVVATNALELGIDIGRMGAAILVGFPGTISSTYQQAGRAGRGEQQSLALLIATPDPLDQYLANHPDYLFSRIPEHAFIDPDNLLILIEHIKCAAFEIPFNSRDSYGRNNEERLGQIIKILLEKGILYNSGTKYFWMSDKYPAEQVSLRSASADNYILLSKENGITNTIGYVDRYSAYWLVHPEAIYLHDAKSYIVQELDLENRLVNLKPVFTSYYTEPSRENEVHLVELLENSLIRGGEKFFGDLLIRSQVTGFRKVKWESHEHLGYGEVNLPAIELLTKGYWFSLNNETLALLRQENSWTGDPNEYGADWNSIRYQVRARDNYTCQACGKKETAREHDIHHIKPFRTFPSRDLANRLDNLITLCQSCHHRAETMVRIRTGLSGLGFVLRHLAPFRLMCDVQDLGVHSDPKSNLADGKPVVVVYDQIPAGIGFSAHLYETHDQFLSQAMEHIQDCRCRNGCPSCVGPTEENMIGGKVETLAILSNLVNSH